MSDEIDLIVKRKMTIFRPHSCTDRIYDMISECDEGRSVGQIKFVNGIDEMSVDKIDEKLFVFCLTIEHVLGKSFAIECVVTK